MLICETHSNLRISFHGYKVIYGSNPNPSRGGVVLLVRNYLFHLVTDIDTSETDQIWFRLKCAINIQFGACYVPPNDSTYYKESNHAFILSKCTTRAEDKKIVFGDLNSRLGIQLSRVNGETLVSYTPVDMLQTPSPHGKRLDTIREAAQLYVVNNMHYNGKHFPGGLSFRRGARWISELDMCLVSRNALDMLINFHVDNHLLYPSDHAPITITLDISGSMYDINALVRSAEQLGSHHAMLRSAQNLHNTRDKPCRRRPIKHTDITQDAFASSLPMNICDMIHNTDSIDQCLEVISDSIYECAKQNIVPLPARHATQSNGDNKWQQILSSNDDKALWKSINWKGEIGDVNLERPSEAAFQEHLESVLNPAEAEPVLAENLRSNVSIPTLDNPIDPSEVDYVLQKQLKSGKAPGLDGIGPGLLKCLPVNFMLALTFFFTLVFYSTYYPVRWSFAKLTMVFKKGNRMLCRNYRGISGIDSLAKVYDYILYNRLSKWFTPDREQAGAQPKRSCMEHILTLRLLMNFSIVKRLKLFILFVDYAQAYDRVPRNKMLKLLIRLGCGAAMICALVAMYSSTLNILGSVTVTSTSGVRQGSPTSCFLFILFVNVLIRNIKEKCQPDGFLRWLHILMLMDDTIIFATSRVRLLEKLEILHDYCESHGMLVNQPKTKFMVLNGNEEDRLPIEWYGIVINHCVQYNYLGSIFTEDGSVASSLKEHCADRGKQLMKLSIFLRTNPDMPFVAKRKVLEACYNSSLLYGCEGWVGCSPRPVNTMYMRGIKLLLGVKSSTPNDLCLVELGIPNLEAFVRHKQATFLRNAIRERSDIPDDPLMFALKLTRDSNRRMQNYIDSLLQVDNHLAQDRDSVLQSVRLCDSTRFTTYKVINPGLEVIDIYSRRKNYVPDHLRKALTQLRLSSHRLRVETGRWSGQARAARLCNCPLNEIQDERHVLTKCAHTAHLRVQDIAYPDILASDQHLKYVFDVSRLFS